MNPIHSKWRIAPVHFVARLFGVLIHIEGLPYGSARIYRTCPEGRSPNVSGGVSGSSGSQQFGPDAPAFLSGKQNVLLSDAVCAMARSGTDLAQIREVRESMILELQAINAVTRPSEAVACDPAEYDHAKYDHIAAVMAKHSPRNSKPGHPAGRALYDPSEFDWITRAAEELRSEGFARASQELGATARSSVDFPSDSQFGS